MSRHLHSNLTSSVYLFHHADVEIDAKSLKHCDGIFPVEWRIKNKQNSPQKDIETQDNKKKSWNIELYKSKIKTRWLSQTFAFSKCMKSTQTFTKENALNLPTGTMTVCDVQTEGKGRGSNKWESPEGCLLFSFISQLSSDKVQCLATMQYVISIAMVDALLSLTQNKIQLQLKWPNDIYYNNMKIGGVLCQSIYDMKRKKYIITSGVGLNVDNKFPTLCINDIIRKQSDEKDEETELVLKKEEILSEFVNVFEPIHESLVQNGFHILKEKYLKYWMHSGQKIMVEQDGKKIEMFIMGVSDNGQLMGQSKTGEIFELHPDGNSFDFLKGLICRKAQT